MTIEKGKDQPQFERGVTFENFGWRKSINSPRRSAQLDKKKIQRLTLGGTPRLELFIQFYWQGIPMASWITENQKLERSYLHSIWNYHQGFSATSITDWGGWSGSSKDGEGKNWKPNLKLSWPTVNYAISKGRLGNRGPEDQRGRKSSNAKIRRIKRERRIQHQLGNLDCTQSLLRQSSQLTLNPQIQRQLRGCIDRWKLENFPLTLMCRSYVAERGKRSTRNNRPTEYLFSFRWGNHLKFPHFFIKI